MATKLIKPVKRELLHGSTLGKHRGKPIIIILEGGDLVSFRIKGTRQLYQTTIHACYKMAQFATWARQYQDKVAVYEAKKKAGYRNLRKPKRINFPIDKAIIDSLK